MHADVSAAMLYPHTTMGRIDWQALIAGSLPLEASGPDQGAMNPCNG